ELDNLIGRILELSKLDIHESELNIERFSLQDLINELLEKFKPMIGSRGLNLKNEISVDSPFFGDREALRTALSNILENAAKFATEGGSIIVNIHSEQDCLVTGITNSFEELAEEDLTRLFDPFFRTEQSRSQGSGLGLAITRKIIERHGGGIEASNSSEGLTVRIRLPRRLSEKGFI
ncbi:MAG: HAMP domain-containing histidine kinase, partial [Deltaproteobacteria bacterium]|nr:HAMP domain-containing histidine kinase [Deltaproteobacteria bacterium]